MAEVFRQAPARADIDERMMLLEARLARIEEQLRFQSARDIQSIGDNGLAAHAEDQASVAIARFEDQLEQELGQSGFAMAGVVALTIGVGFLLSLPYPTLPAVAPALAGIGLSASLLVLAQRGRRRLGVLALNIRAAAMVLLFLATLRLFFFGAESALSLGTVSGQVVLALAILANACIAWRERSPWLTALVLVMTGAAALIVNTGAFVLPVLVAIAGGAVATARLRRWPLVSTLAIPLVYATYLLWALGNPIRDGRFHYVSQPASAPWFLLLTVGIFAAGSLSRPRRDFDDGPGNASAALNCLLGYSVLLLHSAAVLPTRFALLHAVAFAGCLGLAVAFWTRAHSHVSTFFYALTGYLALSMTILKLAPRPEVFIWLSLQSVVVVTTAIWFRSRLIVVANFLILAAIVVGYAFVVEHESGVSVVFGVVALVSARILNWQKNRLELKTELMRNAYLLTAFILFPYALYHLVPARYVALAWIGVAVAYYGMNLIVRNQKYRWMAHATLVLASAFLIFARAATIEPLYRVVSFLVLGSVLVIVSLAFSRKARLASRNAPTD
jgi:hypothetical protein